MRKKILVYWLVYWPLAIVLPLAVAAWVHASKTATGQAPLAAEELTAELARAVSYGLVGGEYVISVKATHGRNALQPAQAA